jgi:hypothetical protein
MVPAILFGVDQFPFLRGTTIIKYMEFLCCIPVATSLSYYFYQEGQATRKRRALQDKLGDTVCVLIEHSSDLFVSFAKNFMDSLNSKPERPKEPSDFTRSPPTRSSTPTIPDFDWDNNMSWVQGEADVWNVVEADHPKSD